MTSITIGDLCSPERWRFIASERLLLHISCLYTALGACLAGGYGGHQNKRRQRLLTPEITGAIVEMTKLRADLSGTCNKDCGCTQEDGSSGDCGTRGRRLYETLGGL